MKDIFAVSEPNISSWNESKIEIILELLSNYFLFFGKLLLNQTVLQIYRFLKNYEGLNPRKVTSQSAVKITTLHSGILLQLNTEDPSS